MKTKSIQKMGSLLGLIILAAVVWYTCMNRMWINGAFLLMAASCLCFVSILLATTGSVNRRLGIAAPSDWLLRTRAQTFLATAWQLAILGLLNLWAIDYSRDVAVFTLSYLSAVIFIVICCILVRFTDNPNQEGGSKPINYFGRPRSRTIFFYGFCYVISPVLFAGIRVFFLTKPSPPPFQPPQLSLLLICVSSMMSTGMVYQRYRSVLSNKAFNARIVLLTLCALGAMAAIQLLFKYDTYVYVLSSITLACIAGSMYWLLQARDAALPSSTEKEPDTAEILKAPGSSALGDSSRGYEFFM